MNEDTGVMIAPLGGIETVRHAMGAHPKATKVQELGVFAMLKLAMNKDNRVNIAYLGGIETAPNAMGTHPKATGCRIMAALLFITWPGSR